jgi:hypothetical protein
MTMRPGRPGYKHHLRNNRPPADQPWAWITAEMMESPAWRALTGPALRVVLRIMLEHMHHGGTENGNLAVTYDDFEKANIDRHTIRTAIAVAEVLGFIDVVELGMKGHGVARRPSRYALTWLPRNDDMAATNRWKAIETAADAKKAVARAFEGKKSSKAALARQISPEARTSLASSPIPSEIYRVVGKSPPGKTQQNGISQWGKAHWISGENNTHSSGENGTGEKFSSEPISDKGAYPALPVMLNGQDHPQEGESRHADATATGQFSPT